MIVLDLPQLYTHPPPSVLLDTLARLTLKPPSWSVVAEREGMDPDNAIVIAEHGIPNYLTSIVISRLQWIEADSREAIWEAASTRLCERSGRVGETILSVPIDRYPNTPQEMPKSEFYSEVYFPLADLE